MPKFISQSIKIFFKGVWQIFFKTTLVPFYKLFLFINKYLHKHILHNPYLSLAQNKTTIKQNILTHIIIFTITIFALINNFTTREIYAEEFNKKSIIAQLLTPNNGEEIVEQSLNFTELNEHPKTESILGQLSAVNNKIIPNTNTKVERDKQLALSQGGEALIQPTVTQFNLTDKAGAAIQKNIKNTTKEITHYVVKPGDTISGIASKFNVSANTILWENNLSLSSYIKPGDKLTILPTTGVSYVVRSGDTLGGIAKKYGTTIKKILTYNDLDSPSNIRVKQKLIIPDGKQGFRSPNRTKSIYTQNKAVASANNFLWPSVSKRITQYFYWKHTAIDIAAPMGTPIYASKAGRVERSGWSTGYGYNVVIDHGGGIKTLYAHASKLYVKRGDQVSQGEVIAAIGSTGWSTGPHVHFEIRINNRKVNPLSYL